MRAMHLTPPSLRRFNSYAIAGVASLATLVLQGILRLWTGDQSPSMFVLPDMVFVAVTLGRGPGFVVMAAGAANALFWAARSSRLTSHPTENAAILLAYLTLGTVITLYGSRLWITKAA